jgi:Fic family protein
METVIEANKENYYLALPRTRQTIRTENQNWEPWVTFFLKTMVKQKDNLAHKVKEERSLREALPALSRTILELASARGEITVREVEDATSANRNTIKAHLKRLAEQDYLVAIGKGRGARYMQKKHSQ